MGESPLAKKANGRKSIRRPKFSSWFTTDEEEIEKRVYRAETESMRVKRIDAERNHPFGLYSVSKEAEIFSSASYTVELRSLRENLNTCSCMDFGSNFLGTCKHIERVKISLPRKFREHLTSPLVEIFIRYDEGSGFPFVSVPENAPSKVYSIIAPFVNSDGFIKEPLDQGLRGLVNRIESSDEISAANFRVSAEVEKRIREIDFHRRSQALFSEFEKNFVAETFLRHPLYPYQQEGMMHLARTGRAMLADEMGLGKTVQAIAAAKALQSVHGIKRVLVVCPASLKAEWEEQIRKFTEMSLTIVYGGRSARVDLYRNTNAFFVIMNYEQVLRDIDEINTELSPDLVILDEAQRIKNWRTKTAQTIKMLDSRFAFVLTGTPLENRIDEIHSLTQFVNSRLLGSLFRFNREFYREGPNGKADGLQNLEKLHSLLKPVMLRRRKSDIADQLPGRVDNNYFVTMTPEQVKRYSDYEYPMMILANKARKRPLTPEEHEQLQKLLACMRMMCDSVYIIDQRFPESPKIDELDSILADLWEAEPGRKVLIFSEWVKMLALARERLDAAGIESAIHTGEIDQKRRRDEINKFKNDPDCLVFLSSDSGSVGLNLQAASVVVNLDLPWNPAKLEQRIARAWRKHQKNSVSVINLVAKGTIEHRMLGTLGYKKGLSDAVLDGMGDFSEIEKPGARESFMGRLSELLDTEFQTQSTKRLQDVPESQKLRAAFAATSLSEIALCSMREDESRGTVQSLFVVSSEPAETSRKLKDLCNALGEREKPLELTVLSLEEHKFLRSLEERGIISINVDSFKNVIRREAATPQNPGNAQQLADLAKSLMASVERPARLATLLSDGGFAREAIDHAREVAGRALEGLYVLEKQEANEQKLPRREIILAALASTLTDSQKFALTSPPPADEESAKELCDTLLGLADLVEEKRIAMIT
ncbi:MAG: DEAD/DEAH box helicase [Planctomycetes bacterium]|nr:DEAD/DEAH box helicase [Planctomycetota bacterium]